MSKSGKGSGIESDLESEVRGGLVEIGDISDDEETPGPNRKASSDSSGLAAPISSVPNTSNSFEELKALIKRVEIESYINAKLATKLAVTEALRSQREQKLSHLSTVTGSGPGINNNK